jgi:hypothetical protein
VTKSQKAKCRKIAETYGLRNQETQAVSELTELQYVLTRRPNQRTTNWKEQLVDEIADVRIMCRQLQTLYDIDDDTINEKIDYKLNRQLGRIKEEKT